MAEDVMSNVFTSFYQGLLNRFAVGDGLIVNIFLLTLLITVASIFIFRFYRTISQRDLISLNLFKYNRSNHPAWSKIGHIFLFFIEYIIIMPIVILLWFTALSILILLIAPERAIVQILTITGAMVASIRVLAYHNGEISKDLAKLFPFITLSVFLISGATGVDFGRIVSQLGEIPVLFNNVLIFLLFIFAIEIILRVFYTMYEFWQSEEVPEEDEKKIKK